MKWVIMTLMQIVFLILVTFPTNAQEPSKPTPHPIQKGTPSRQEFSFERAFNRIPGDYKLQLKNGALTLPEGIGSSLSSIITESKSQAGSPATTPANMHLILQLKLQPDEKESLQLKNLGVQKLEYIPNGGFLVKIPFTSIDALIKMPIFRSLTDIKSEWKIQPSLKEKINTLDASVKTDIIVLLFENRDELINSYRLKPWGKDRYLASLNKNEITELSKSEYLRWMEYRAPVKPALSESIPITGANDAWSGGASGSGVGVAVIDSGIERNHPHFNNSSVSNAKDWVDQTDPPQDEYGHGTAVAGVIAGSSVYQGRSLLGVASATLVISRIYQAGQQFQYPATFAEIFDDVINHGAMIVNGSWGHESNTDYDSDAQVVDEYARNHPEVLFVFANGNYPTHSFMISLLWPKMSWLWAPAWMAAQIMAE